MIKHFKSASYIKVTIMKPLLLTLCIIFGTLYCAQAQTKDTIQTDVVVLNDGSIIKGERIDPHRPGYVRVRMIDGTEVEVPIESIAEIRKDMPSQQRQPRKPHQVRERGLYAVITAGFLFGHIEQDPLSFTSGGAIGYRLLPQLYVAGGAGTDIYGASGDVFVPVFMRVGGEAMKTRVSPSYYFSTGYAFLVDSPREYFDVKGGAFYEGGLGATFRTPGRIYWTLNLTYRQHKAERSYENDWWWGNDGSFTTEKRTYRRFGINVGMCF